MATAFEYRYKAAVIGAIYAAAYAFYGIDRLNIVYSVLPWNRGVGREDLAARAAFAMAAVVAGLGASLLTWASASRPRKVGASLVTCGPYRYTRHPMCLGHMLVLAGFGLFQSRIGFPLMIMAEGWFLWRVIGRSEAELGARFGEEYRRYQERVPRLWPLRRAGVEVSSGQRHWVNAFVDQLLQWGLVVTLVAFVVTLSDAVAYRFVEVSLGCFVAAKLVQFSIEKGDKRQV